MRRPLVFVVTIASVIVFLVAGTSTWGATVGGDGS